MKKIVLFNLENRDEVFVDYDKDDFFEGFYDSYTKIIDKEAQEKLKELGVDVEELFYDRKDLKSFVEDKNLDEETKEEIQYILNDLYYLPQVCEGYYCEDVHSKSDIEELENELFFIDYDGYIADKDDILDLCDETYYCYWDGSNHRCAKVEWIEEIEIEYEYTNHGDTYSKIYYTTKGGNKLVVFSSMYQGSLPIVDEDECDINKILDEIEKEEPKSGN